MGRTARGCMDERDGLTYRTRYARHQQHDLACRDRRRFGFVRHCAAGGAGTVVERDHLGMVGGRAARRVMR